MTEGWRSTARLTVSGWRTFPSNCLDDRDEDQYDGTLPQPGGDGGDGYCQHAGDERARDLHEGAEEHNQGQRRR